MNTLRKILAATVVAAAGLASGAAAQSSANVSTTGSATIFQPISIAKNGDLRFGVIVRPLTGTGTVTQPAAGGPRTFTGGVALLNTAGFPSPQPATFTVTGEGGQTFTIGIPPSFTMTGPSSSSLNVNLASSAASGTLSNALGAAGTAPFGVGGTITNISDTTASGTYTGNFTVTVTYN